MNYDNQRVKFKCKICQVMFTSPKQLLTHKSQRHPESLGRKGDSSGTDANGLSSLPAKRASSSSKSPQNERPGPSRGSASIKSPSKQSVKSNENAKAEAQVKCRFCPSYFASQKQASVHERSHTGEKEYSCQHCLKGYDEEEALKIHEKSCPVLDILKKEAKRAKRRSLDYGDDEEEENEDSSKDTQGILALPQPYLPQIIHHATGSKLGINYECQLCKEKFVLKVEAVSHLKSHLGDQVFQCKHCDECFGSKNDAASHVNTHMEEVKGSETHSEQVWKKTKIAAKFQPDTDVYILDEQMNGRRIFRCKICDHRIIHQDRPATLYRNSIRYHVRKCHTGTQLLTCPRCKKPSASKFQLRVHLKQVHGVVVEPSSN